VATLPAALNAAWPGVGVHIVNGGTDLPGAGATRKWDEPALQGAGDLTVGVIVHGPGMDVQRAGRA